MNMYSLLQRKFPQKTGNWKDALLMSLIVFLMLFLLKPFGLDRYDRLTGLLFPVCLGYAVITFLASLGFQRAVACFVRRERVSTLLDVLLSSLLTWLLMGLVNFLYSILLFPVDTRHWWIVLFYFVFWTFIIGSLLTLITVLINYNRYLKSELAEMIHRTTDEQKDIWLTIRDEAVYGECLEIPINHFLYAESMKNDIVTKANTPLISRAKPGWVAWLVVWMCCGLSSSLWGQASRHEISIGFGLGDDTHLNSVERDYRDAYPLDEGDGVYDNLFKSYNRTVCLSYVYHLNRRWALGASVGWSRCEGDGLSGTDGELWSSYREWVDVTTESRALFFLPSAKYTWYGRSRFACYSKGGLGVSRYRFDARVSTSSYPGRSERRFRMVYQVSPLGIEWGGTRLRAFGELGYGQHGVFNLGLLLRM